ncbi:hypothetical protein AD006_32200 (plasmid) [Pseudonocardia sp. EC080610-09]|nr:hypothetical protein AD006_28340 [Pseudonocardia sp. EC080610-09]ALL79780.1 hypothetical protein AD006_32200 [Pseudonocardia sp. EC080610-09]ALL85217.1 hypothetical protein AD017_28730 [Pseudonocardia sp. EC080619-01]
MPRSEVDTFLRDGHTGILTTLRSDGMPIAMPVWYALVEGTVIVETRGKKLARLRHDPRASFLVESGRHWAELRAVHLTGWAEVLSPDTAAAIAEPVRVEMARKYATYRTDLSEMPAPTREVYESGGTLVRLHPDERILHWDNRRLGLPIS